MTHARDVEVAASEEAVAPFVNLLQPRSQVPIATLFKRLFRNLSLAAVSGLRPHWLNLRSYALV